MVRQCSFFANWINEWVHQQKTGIRAQTDMDELAAITLELGDGIPLEGTTWNGNNPDSREVALQIQIEDQARSEGQQNT